jgi:TolB protein
MKNFHGSVARVLALSLVSFTVAGQQSPKASLGLFKETADIGTTRPGAASFSEGTGSYRVTGGGADLWGKEDDFRFLWLPLTGDATLEADITFPVVDVVPKEKAMLIFRQSNQPDAAYADLALHGDGHIALQFRKTDGGQTEDLTATQRGSRHLRLERKGDHFTASLGNSASTMEQVLSTDVALHDQVLVGVGVCAHDANAVHAAVFSNVKLVRSAASESQK